MIIDELQNYGRPVTNDDEPFLDPKHTNFDYNNGRIIFEIDKKYNDYERCKKKYNMECVYNKLAKKIEPDSLNKMGINFSCLGCLLALFN